ncbi:NAC domain-containing protein 72-like [Tripterygium wilfordii]|uniref:NAC domain-containing protein 72-like n=1 Tax=Tripterygium wilfordii TaxID=458696 RepID=UPI0018F824D8|nr:NAC domain-containing protein 72-like [Tripterygium wilfordii]
MDQPGHRYNPTKEEILDYYLPHKVRGNHSQVYEIAEIDNILKYEPWDLPGLVAIPPSKRKWHFFSPRNRGRTKRQTKAGFWKVTGRSLVLKNIANQVIIKRYLVFYTGGSSKQEWTNWAMHEYYLKPSDSNERGYVVYRLRQKPPQIKKTVNLAADEGEPSRDSASMVENPITDISLPEIDQFMDEILNSDEQDFTSRTEHQPSMHISQDSSFVNLQGTNGTINDYTKAFSQFGVGDQHTVLDGSSTSGSLDSPYIGYINCTEAVNATVNHCLPEMHMVQGLSYENFQQTNGNIDDYSFLLSQSGASGQLDNISELEKTFSAIPDGRFYCGNILTAPSEPSPSVSLGRLHGENISDIGGDDGWGWGWGWGWDLDWLFELASAYSSYT